MFCLQVCMCTTSRPGAQEYQKRRLNPLELESHEGVGNRDGVLHRGKCSYLLSHLSRIVNKTSKPAQRYKLKQSFSEQCEGWDPEPRTQARALSTAEISPFPISYVRVVQPQANHSFVYRVCQVCRAEGPEQTSSPVFTCQQVQLCPYL